MGTGRAAAWALPLSVMLSCDLADQGSDAGGG